MNIASRTGGLGWRLLLFWLSADVPGVVLGATIKTIEAQGAEAVLAQGVDLVRIGIYGLLLAPEAIVLWLGTWLVVGVSQRVAHVGGLTRVPVIWFLLAGIALGAIFGVGADWSSIPI